MRKLEQASFDRIAVQAGMTLQALVPDTKRLKLRHENLTGSSHLVTGPLSFTIQTELDATLPMHDLQSGTQIAHSRLQSSDVTYGRESLRLMGRKSRRFCGAA
jgi:hypothetical protein